MTIFYDPYTDAGNRENNEDSLLARLSPDGEKGLFVVADGMGGHYGGEIASNLLTKRLGETWDKAITDSLPSDEIIERLTATVRTVNDELFEDYSSQGEEMVCGCTLALLAVLGSSVFIMNVGDSRVYSYKKGEVSLESIDHVYAQDVRRREEAAISAIPDSEEKRNAVYTWQTLIGTPSGERITSAVGALKNYRTDMKTLPVSNTSFFLCSDGVYKYTPEDTIRKAMHKSDADFKEYIKECVIAGGAGDNYTFIHIRISGINEGKNIDRKRLIYLIPISVGILSLIGAAIAMPRNKNVTETGTVTETETETVTAATVFTENSITEKEVRSSTDGRQINTKGQFVIREDSDEVLDTGGTFNSTDESEENTEPGSEEEPVHETTAGEIISEPVLDEDVPSDVDIAVPDTRESISGDTSITPSMSLTEPGTETSNPKAETTAEAGNTDHSEDMTNNTEAERKAKAVEEAVETADKKTETAQDEPDGQSDDTSSIVRNQEERLRSFMSEK